MAAADIEAVAHLEREVFGSGWTVQAYLTELSNPSAIYLVALVDGALVGFCGYHQIMDEAHVTTIAVSPGFRGRRIGERLMCGMLVVARERGAVQGGTGLLAKGREAYHEQSEKFSDLIAEIREDEEVKAKGGSSAPPAPPKDPAPAGT